jgi:hypothetical protein
VTGAKVSAPSGERVVGALVPGALVVGGHDGGVNAIVGAKEVGAHVAGAAVTGA